jgi:hypothetical protein
MLKNLIELYYQWCMKSREMNAKKNTIWNALLRCQETTCKKLCSGIRETKDKVSARAKSLICSALIGTHRVIRVSVERISGRNLRI